MVHLVSIILIGVHQVEVDVGIAALGFHVGPDHVGLDDQGEKQ